MIKAILDLLDAIKKWLRKSWTRLPILVLILIAWGSIFCFFVGYIESLTGKFCIQDFKGRVRCLPTDPGGHIVALGTSPGSVNTGVNGHATLYTNTSVASTNCSGSWETSANPSLPSGYSAVTDDMLVSGSATMETVTDGGALGSYGWTPKGNGRCYVVGFAEKSGSSYLAETYSAPFWEDVGNYQGNVVACASTTNADGSHTGWSWVSGLSACK